MRVSRDSDALTKNLFLWPVSSGRTCKDKELVSVRRSTIVIPILFDILAVGFTSNMWCRVICPRCFSVVSKVFSIFSGISNYIRSRVTFYDVSRVWCVERSPSISTCLIHLTWGDWIFCWNNSSCTKTQGWPLGLLQGGGEGGVIPLSFESPPPPSLTLSCCPRLRRVSGGLQRGGGSFSSPGWCPEFYEITSEKPNCTIRVDHNSARRPPPPKSDCGAGEERKKIVAGDGNKKSDILRGPAEAV